MKPTAYHMKAILATLFSMSLCKISPSDTRDELGRKCFHQYGPEISYCAPHDQMALEHDFFSKVDL